MNIAFYLENRGIPNVDLSQPYLGNPGCGGTEYMFAALPSYLADAGDRYRPVILANHVNRLPDNVACHRVPSVLDAARRAKEEGCEIFVYRPRRHLESELLALLDELSLPTIARFSITPTGPYLLAMAKSSSIKAVVCIGREQHDLAWDSPVWSKLTCIPNGLDVDGFRLARPPAKESNLVVYLGALVPQKGFHLLARAWPNILRRHPSSRLAVIGSGDLYDESTRLGPWGVASPEYEAKFAPYLSARDGRPHPSVSFLGRLGREKKEWLHRAVVGVPNPTGATETFCASAWEFQACGTPVVSAARYSLLDAVRHGETGLLGHGVDDLVNNICVLLKAPTVADALGRNGVEFVRSAFSVSSMTEGWIDLFDRLTRNGSPKFFFLKPNLHQHAKTLVLVNRLFQMTLGRLFAWPSVVDVKTRLAKIPPIGALIALRMR